MSSDPRHRIEASNAIAIVGMACRFPGADDPDQFWSNLLTGVESVRRFSREELLAAGVRAEVADHQDYVPAHAALGEIAGFDAAFFGYSPAEAALIDPQQRLFLECAWEALERGGFRTGNAETLTGVFAGSGANIYLLRHAYPALDVNDAGTAYQAIIANDKDYLASRVAYKLDLRGPALALQAACATGLVCVHAACQSLLAGECDMALAGSVFLQIPQESGHIHQTGGIQSADGHCRPFDERAGGIVTGSGMGVVVLKPLQDARRNGDFIHAVILGTSVGNDGAHKISFTAPGVDGEAAVISEARAIAGVEPETIGYAEMHGTATPIGDPIEIAAFRKSLGAAWKADWRCHIGSVKSNVGHLDVAAGICGLIKTALVLQHGLIPPSLHFERPNRNIDFESGPLRVCSALTPWRDDGLPRRASVSSFGLGGCNAHAVLQQAEPDDRQAERIAWRFFPLSARTEAALQRMRVRLATHLDEHSDLRAEDVAWTLSEGRTPFWHVGFAVARSSAELADSLGQDTWTTAVRPDSPPQIAFLFPGENAHTERAARELYDAHPAFSEAFDECAEALLRAGSPDIRMSTSVDAPSSVMADLQEFGLGHALAALWKSLGIDPAITRGWGPGELAAAVCSGTLSLDAAARRLTSPRSGTNAGIASQHWVTTTAEGLVADGYAICIEIGSDPSQAQSKRFLENVGRAWLSGVTVNWAGLFRGDEPRRVPLPAYPFEHTRHWIEAGPVPAAVKTEPPPEQPVCNLLAPCWTRSAPLPKSEVQVKARWLVVGGEDEFTMRIVTRLKREGASVTNAAEYDGSRPQRVLHTASLCPNPNPAEGFYSAMRCAKAIALQGHAVEEFAVLCSGAFDVTGDEPLNPFQAMLAGPVLGAFAELPRIRCRCIDIGVGDTHAADLLIAELTSASTSLTLALRNRHRWTFEMKNIADASRRASPIRKRGTYLITGGFGSVGIALARKIAESGPVCVALVGRSKFPHPDLWPEWIATHSPEDATTRRIEKLREIVQNGTTVRVFQADCADEAAMRGVISALIEERGKIDGIVHAAGVAGGGSVARRTRSDMESVLRPKITGASVLSTLTAGIDLDFLVFCSSINSLLPVAGQADYAAANAFLDTHAALLRRRGVPATAINWDAWRGAGMAAEGELPEPLRTRRREELAACGLPAELACDAFMRLLGTGLGQVAVVTSRRFEALPAASAVVEPYDPLTGVRQGLSQVWRTLLGVADVEPQDDFFKLGGHSLLATSLTFRIRELWGCNVTVDELFSHSTVESLGNLIEERLAMTADREVMLL